MSLLRQIYGKLNEKDVDHNIHRFPCAKTATFSHPVDTIYHHSKKETRYEPYNTLYGIDSSVKFAGSNVKSQHQRMLYPQMHYSPVRNIVWEKSSVKPINPFDYTKELTVEQLDVLSRNVKKTSGYLPVNDKKQKYIQMKVLM